VDVSKTRINQVLRNWGTLSWQPLSQPIHKQLAAHCEPHIIAAWSKMRGLLLYTDPAIPVRRGNEMEMFTSLEFELLKQIFTGPGWIHNSYFEIQIIRKLIYYALQERSGIGHSAALMKDDEAGSAYQAIRPREEVEQSVSKS
jgi:hypothetical protein